MCPAPSIQTTDDHSTSVEVIEKSRDLTEVTIKGDPNAYHLWPQVT